MDELHDRALRAYEIGRVKRALPWALPAVALAALAGGGVAVAVVLGLTLVGLRWAGREPGRGAAPGLAIGLLGFAVPVGWEAWNASCCAGGGCAPNCLAVCTAAGLGAGVVLWRHLTRTGASRTTALAALGVASLTTGIGCLQLGTLGLVGVGALWLATLPALLTRPIAA